MPDSASAARAARIEELSRLLNTAAQDLDRAVAAGLDGLTVPQWHVLTAVDGGVGCAMAGLAAATCLPGPSLTRLIDGMVDDNLVHRRVDDTDRRRVLVFATRRGAAALSRARARIIKADNVLDITSGDTEAIRRLRELLGELSVASPTAL